MTDTQRKLAAYRQGNLEVRPWYLRTPNRPEMSTGTVIDPPAGPLFDTEAA